MTALDDDIPRRKRSRPTPSAGAWHGFIAEDAVSAYAKVSVIIPEFSETLRFGPCRFMPRIQHVLIDLAEPPETSHPQFIGLLDIPSKGLECLVMFSNRREPWIIAWWRDAPPGP